MTNQEEFKKADTECHRLVNSMGDIKDAFTVLNVTLSLYLPVIAKSLAVIADNMSEEKED